MYSASFEYHRPKNVREAIALLRKNKDAKILAGGHSLLPAMKLRVAAPSAVIDIGRLKGLDAIKAGKSAIRIGGLTTHAAIAASREVKKLCPMLSEAASLIGDIQVRNRGTIGGSLAHADPAADYPSVMLALDAKITATGNLKKRVIAAEKFFVDIFTTSLKASEILTEVSVPTMKAGQGGCYLKHRHPASSYAVVGVAAFVSLKKGACKDVRLVVGGAAPNPVIAQDAANELIGEAPSAKLIATAAGLVEDAIEFPLSDVYASGEYRTHLAVVLARRALTEAFKRAKRQK